MPVVVFHGIALMYHLIGQRPFGIFYHNLGLLKMKKKDQPSLSIRFTSITEDFLTLKKYALSGLIRIITNGSVTFVSSGKIMLILVHRFMGDVRSAPPWPGATPNRVFVPVSAFFYNALAGKGGWIRRAAGGIPQH